MTLRVHAATIFLGCLFDPFVSVDYYYYFIIIIIINYYYCYSTIISDCFPAWQLPHHSGFDHLSLQALHSITLKLSTFIYFSFLSKNKFVCDFAVAHVLHIYIYLYILYKSMNICIPNKRLDMNFLQSVFLYVCVYMYVY